MRSPPRCHKTMALALVSGVILALAIVGPHLAEAQSAKGQPQQPQQQQQVSLQNNNNQQNGRNSYSAAPSPVTQLRNQQQQQQAPVQQQQVYNTQSRPTPTAETKRRPQQQQQQPQQTQQQQVNYDAETGGAADSTEDPLADSEPAIYGSVAGQPGVDFPAYTRIPKTSFTCEGKGYDFGFYADEEASCQVYHVCWEGRRESFLCGVGTVFNQAILACDYWHSVDCSKSSQFYGVNSELGKSNAEPAPGSRRQQARQPATLPPAVTSSNNQNTYSTKQNQQGQSPISVRDQDQDSFGEPLNTNRAVAPAAPVQQPIVQQRQQQQQQQYDDTFDAPQQPIQQQKQQQQPISSSSSTTRFGAKGSTVARAAPPTATTNSFVQQPRQSYEFQQRIVHPSPHSEAPQPAITTTTTTTATNGPTTKNPQRNYALPSTTPAAPPAAVKRPRFNMDFQQKVTSLIESPVRPPLKQAPLSPPPQSSKGPQQQQQRRFEQVPSSPARQQLSNLGQNAVQRAQQTGSQKLNAGLSRKQTAPAPQAPVQQVAQSVSSQPIVQQSQQQLQSFDNELDEPQVVQQRQQPEPPRQVEQQQQQLIDDSPVQTSTQANYGGKSLNPPFSSNNNNNDNFRGAADSNNYNNNNNNLREQIFNQQQQQQQQPGTTIIRAGNGLDGSSAITTQYDTMTPVGQQQQQLQSQGYSNPPSAPSSSTSSLSSNADSSYESSLDDSNSGANDDFRSAGAKAAASHNQNWYIMRSI